LLALDSFSQKIQWKPFHRNFAAFAEETSFVQELLRVVNMQKIAISVRTFQTPQMYLTLSNSKTDSNQFQIFSEYC